MTQRLSLQRGLTIIELVMFIVITGVAAAGIIGVLNIGSRSSADPLLRKQAMMIAEALMEEVQLAHFTYCDPADATAATAKSTADCTNPVKIGTRPAGVGRPYGNVADYVTKLNTPEHSFFGTGPNATVDVDVSGRPLGVYANAVNVGNSSLGGITSTVTLNVLDGSASNGALGPAGHQIVSAAANLTVLRITIRTTYGANGEFIELDGYRTRYAPTYIP
jgi:MSHA pilin protein MshD